MYISSLTLQNFRNYASEKIEFSPYTNVIYGDNAQGKTNILEAVYLFSQGRSHRAKTDRELIKFGKDFAKLGLEFHDSDRDYKASVQLIKNGKKNIKINHVQITKLSMLMSYLNVVMFSPEDLGLVKGAPSERRRFIDSAISRLYPRYLTTACGRGREDNGVPHRICTRDRQLRLKNTEGNIGRGLKNNLRPRHKNRIGG